nr:MAG TPA: hypothetical protein [Caudoviricetes sp.]
MSLYVTKNHAKMVASRAVGIEITTRLLCVHRDLLLLVAWVLR